MTIEVVEGDELEVPLVEEVRRAIVELVPDAEDAVAATAAALAALTIAADVDPHAVIVSYGEALNVLLDRVARG
jgi:hypothetical protein